MMPNKESFGYLNPPLLLNSCGMMTLNPFMVVFVISNVLGFLLQIFPFLTSRAVSAHAFLRKMILERG